MIEGQITKNTKAILITHMYGMPTEMEKICSICKDKGLLLFEDCAQSHFSTYKEKHTGTFGNAAFFSFYPTKNLGCFGDGGAIVSRDDNFINRIKVLRNYGSDRRYHNVEVGFNSRLDEIQAGLLRVRLSHWDCYLNNRRHIADRHTSEINNRHVRLPLSPNGSDSIWYMYAINVDERERFRDHMRNHGIATDVSYPMPPYLQPALQYLGIQEGSYLNAESDCKTIVSIPMMDYMDEEEIDSVIQAVNCF